MQRDLQPRPVCSERYADLQVHPVDRGRERQQIHVLDDRAVRGVLDFACGVAERQSEDRPPVPAVRDVLDGEIEFVARDEIDGRRGLQDAEGVDRHLRAGEAGLEARIGRLQRLDRLDVGGERRRRSVQDREIEVLRFGDDFRELDPVRRCVDQLTVLNKRCRLREPVRIPERSDLALRLVARAGAAVEPIERGRLKKQRPHHSADFPFSLTAYGVMFPFRSTE